MGGLEFIIPNLAAMVGVPASTLLVGLTIIGVVSNIVGRVIPDDETGFLGGVRRVAKVIGVYVPNKVTSGVTVNDVVRSVINTPVDEKADATVHDLAADASALIPAVTAAFPGAQKTVEDIEREIARGIGG